MSYLITHSKDLSNELCQIFILFNSVAIAETIKLNTQSAINKENNKKCAKVKLN